MNEQKRPLIKQGWLRALIFLLPWLGVAYLFDTGASKTIGYLWGNEAAEMGGNLPTIVRFFIAAIGSTVVVWLWRKLIDRRSFTSLGFQYKNFEIDAWIGFFTAPVLLGIGTLLLAFLSYLQFSTFQIDAEQLLLEAVLMLIIAYSEEVVVRGYLLNNLLQSMNKWAALSVTALFFGLLHLGNPDATALSIINILAAGFLLGVNYIYTKNLWFGMLFHFSWNFFQGPVFGYEVSGLQFSGIFQQNLTGPQIWTGGSFGFEGSLLCPVLTIAATVIYIFYFSKKYPSHPLAAPAPFFG